MSRLRPFVLDLGAVLLVLACAGLLALSILILSPIAFILKIAWTRRVPPGSGFSRAVAGGPV